jgi:dTDP-4-amino-4,6-dideoxygalactose transaminase
MKTFDYLKNFGFESQVEVVMPGTNAKMNEMQALMGLQVLDHLDEVIKNRKIITEVYMERLKDIPGLKLPTPLPDDVEYNYAYMPIEVNEKEMGISRDGLFRRLKEYNVFARRYFYPLVCDYACYKHVSVNDSLNTARKVSSKILALPVYDSLEIDDVHKICDIIQP